MRPALTLSVVLSLTTLAGVRGLPGQTPPTNGASASGGVHVEARAALLTHGTGAEQCDSGTGLSAGAVVGTRGTWVLKATADVLLSWAVVCETYLPLTEYEGRTVEVWGRTEFLFAPRVAAHLGRTFRPGRLRLRASVGGGLIRTVTDFGAHGDPSTVRYALKRARWRPWYGVTLGIEPLPGGLTAQLEVGHHRVPRRYYAVPEDGGDLVREFTVRRVLARLGVAIPVWSGR